MACAGKGQRGRKGSASGVRARSRPAPAAETGEAVLLVNPVNVSMAKPEVGVARIPAADQIAFGADFGLRLRGLCGAFFAGCTASQSAPGCGSCLKNNSCCRGGPHAASDP